MVDDPIHAVAALMFLFEEHLGPECRRPPDDFILEIFPILSDFPNIFEPYETAALRIRNIRKFQLVGNYYSTKEVKSLIDEIEKSLKTLNILFNALPPNIRAKSEEFCLRNYEIKFKKDEFLGGILNLPNDGTPIENLLFIINELFYTKKLIIILMVISRNQYIWKLFRIQNRFEIFH